MHPINILMNFLAEHNDQANKIFTLIVCNIRLLTKEEKFILNTYMPSCLHFAVMYIPYAILIVFHYSL